MDLLEQFKTNVRTLGLAADAPPTLLAVSGGVDSMVLAHLFRLVGLPFGIAHCNFQLRGEESDGDAVFVEKTATEWGVPFFIKCFETETYATQHGVSIQMAARDLRYAWFAEICAEHGFAHLATAHHLNDAVETMLLNLVRGTGLRGLAARVNPTPDPSPTGRGDEAYAEMLSQISFASAYASSLLPAGEGSGVGWAIFRPLSATPRADIEAYAQAHDIAWREDRSNASDDYARNFIRHHVVPLLTELNPNFLHTAGRNMRRLGEVEANYEWLIEEYFNPTPDPSPTGRGDEIYSDIVVQSLVPPPSGGVAGGGVDKTLLRRLPAARQALHELLRPYGFTEEQARQLADNLDHIGLELHSTTGWRVLNDRAEIIVASTNQQPIPTSPHPHILIQKDDLMVSLPDGSRLLLMPSAPQPPFPDGREAVLVDAARLQFPLTLRAWQAGDWFQPFGMGGQRQKLQDFFVNQKLTRFDKERAWVLENGDGAIVWVLGHRLDERFRVTAQTERGLKIGLA